MMERWVYGRICRSGINKKGTSLVCWFFWFCFVFAIIWKFLSFVLKAILDKLKDLLTQKEVILSQKFGPLLF